MEAMRYTEQRGPENELFSLVGSQQLEGMLRPFLWRGEHWVLERGNFCKSVKMRILVLEDDNSTESLFVFQSAHRPALELLRNYG